MQAFISVANEGHTTVGLLCHLTFAYRISLLSESRIVGVVIAAVRPD